MTRTDAVLAAVREEIEAWRPAFDAAPALRCVTVVTMLRPDGSVRTVLVRPESERPPEAERNADRISNGGVKRL